MSTGSHFISISCTSSQSMHYVSHWAPGATRFQRPLYLANSDVLGLLWAIEATLWTTSRYIHFQTFSPILGATSYQCLVHLANRCTVYPHWAPGATRFQRPLHLPISDGPGPLWAIGATTRNTSRSIHFQTCNVPNEPWKPLRINVMYI